MSVAVGLLVWIAVPDSDDVGPDEAFALIFAVLVALGAAAGWLLRIAVAELRGRHRGSRPR